MVQKRVKKRQKLGTKPQENPGLSPHPFFDDFRGSQKLPIFGHFLTPQKSRFGLGNPRKMVIFGIFGPFSVLV